MDNIFKKINEYSAFLSNDNFQLFLDRINTHELQYIIKSTVSGDFDYTQVEEINFECPIEEFIYENVLNASISIKTSVSSIIDEILSSYMLKEKKEEFEISVLLDLAEAAGTVNEILLQTFITQQNYDVSNLLKEKAAVILSNRKLSDDLKSFWLSLDYDVFPFCFAHSIAATINNSDVDFGLALYKRINTLSNKVTPTLTQYSTELVRLYIESKEIKAIERETSDDDLLSFSPEVLKYFQHLDSKYLSGELFDFSLDYFFYKNTRERTINFQQNTVIDLSLLTFLYKEGILEKFNYKINFFRYNWEEQKEQNRRLKYVDSYRLFDSGFLTKTGLAKELKLMTNRTVITLPRQLIPNNYKNKVQDIAISNVFNHVLITNDSSIDENAHFAKKLWVALQNGHKFFAYDEQGEAAIRNLLKFCLDKYNWDYQLFKDPDIEKLTQSELRGIIDKPDGNVTITCTAPILAYGLEKEFKILLSLNSAKEDIKNYSQTAAYPVAKEDLNGYLQRINDLYIHTCVQAKQDELQEDIRLAKMVLYGVEYIRRNKAKFVDFAFSDELINSDSGKVKRENLEKAIEECYKYIPTDLYDLTFYEKDSVYELKGKSKSSILYQTIFLEKKAFENKIRQLFILYASNYSRKAGGLEKFQRRILRSIESNWLLIDNSRIGDIEDKLRTILDKMVDKNTTMDNYGSQFRKIS